MKLFVCSDIHSYYYPLITTLEKAGFDKDNPEHYLIVCGDCFDRGPDSGLVHQYLMSLERKVLIRGNHDYLLNDCCIREFPLWNDHPNGTVRTIQDLGDMGMGYTFEEACQRTWEKLQEYRAQLVNYFETEHYIFVHSWLPIRLKERECPDNKWIPLATSHYKENWRDASDEEWEEAMWGNPFQAARKDLNETGKTIVFGHWHCSAGYVLNDLDAKYEEFDEHACWDPYHNAEQGIIGIDRCTHYTGEINVLVLEDDFIK